MQSFSLLSLPELCLLNQLLWRVEFSSGSSLSLLFLSKRLIFQEKQKRITEDRLFQSSSTHLNVGLQSNLEQFWLENCI